MKAFLQGLGAGLFLLLLLVVWLWLRGPQTAHERQARLSSATVAIAAGSLQSGITLENAPPADAHGPVAEPAPPKVAVMALGPVPADGLYETAPEGKLPVIDRHSGRTPFQAYRRPFEAAQAAGKPLISLVVADIGLSQAAADSAVAGFPGEVSLALSPYASAPDALIGAARAKGHEVWMTLPMQSPAYPRVDPGPHTLLVGVPKEDNLKKLTWLMGRATGYAGFIGTSDADFTAATSDVSPVMDALYERGLGFIDPSMHLPLVPADPSHHYAAADVWFERSVSKTDIDHALAQLEIIAKKNGHAIGVIQPLPLAYPAIGAWIASLPQKGFVLAPVSAQADTTGGAAPAAPSAAAPPKASP